MTESAVPAAVVAELVAAARGYLRLADDVEAALLARLAESAVLTAEAFCGAVFVARGFDAVLAPVTGWQRLAALPVTAITVAGLAVADYAVDIDADGVGWVRVSATAPVAVSYTAGVAASLGDLPPPVAQGMVALTAYLFEARDGAGLPPAAVAALWRPFRRLRLMEPVR